MSETIRLLGLDGYDPDMYEEGRYFDSKFCKICGCELADNFLQRHFQYHREVAELIAKQVAPPDPQPAE